MERERIERGEIERDKEEEKKKRISGRLLCEGCCCFKFFAVNVKNAKWKSFPDNVLPSLQNRTLWNQSKRISRAACKINFRCLS